MILAVIAVRVFACGSVSQEDAFRSLFNALTSISLTNIAEKKKPQKNRTSQRNQFVCRVDGHPMLSFRKINYYRLVT